MCARCRAWFFALLLALLNSVFILVLASVVLRGLSIDCGCFGPDAGTTPLQALGRDLVLLALAIAVYRQQPRYAAPAPPGARWDRDAGAGSPRPRSPHRKDAP